MYIVAYTLEGGVNEFSDYEAFDELKDAKARYDELLTKDSLYSVSIAGVMESTDYDTAKELKC